MSNNPRASQIEVDPTGLTVVTTTDMQAALAELDAAAGGGSSALVVQDENSNVSTAVTQIDFQGAGVTATTGAGEVIVTIPGAGGGPSGLVPTSKTGNYTASPGDLVLANTGSGSFTVTLPSSPTAGDLVAVAKTAGATGTVTVSSSAGIGPYGSVGLSHVTDTITVVWTGSRARANPS